MTEDQAVQRCQLGDRDAFRCLVERYQDLVFGTAYNMTRNRAVAEEMAQEAFLSAWKGMRGFRLGRPFKPWLMRILVNTVMAHRRRRSVETAPLEESSGPGDAEHPAAVVDSELERQALQRAIMGLSPDHRQVVVLRYYAEMTVPEVARASGVNEGTVKSRLHRAHRELRRRLGETREAAGVVDER